MAPERSERGGGVKNAQHTTITNVQRSAPIIPRAKPWNPGTMAFTPNRDSHCSTTATTPGHSLSGFRDAGSSAFLMLMPVLWLVIKTPTSKAAWIGGALTQQPFHQSSSQTGVLSMTFRSCVDTFA